MVDPQLDEKFVFFSSGADDLKSADNLKRVAALSRALHLGIEGLDISSLFVNAIKVNLAVNNQKIVKLLSYQILKYCRFTEPQWSELLPLFVIDMMGDDEDLQVAALKSLPFLPSGILREGLQSELLGFNPCFNGIHTSRFHLARKASTEALACILLNQTSLVKVRISSSDSLLLQDSIYGSPFSNIPSSGNSAGS